MSGKFKPLAEGFWVAPQIEPGDIAAAKALGVRVIINNRPDGEEPGQPDGAAIEQAAKAAGLAYRAVPVSGMNIGPDQLDGFDAAAGETDGPVLAYCRSGARSTVLRAMARARSGGDPDALIAEAAEAGYDLSGLRSQLEALARG